MILITPIQMMKARKIRTNLKIISKECNQISLKMLIFNLILVHKDTKKNCSIRFKNQKMQTKIQTQQNSSFNSITLKNSQLEIGLKLIMIQILKQDCRLKKCLILNVLPTTEFSNGFMIAQITSLDISILWFSSFTFALTWLHS